MTIYTEKISSTATNRINKDWKLQPTSEKGEKESYSADTVINAYLRGREDENIENQKILSEKFNENLDKAMALSSTFSNTLSGKNIKCKLVLLRPETITEFESIFIIDEKDYISPQFEEIYRLAISEKTKINSDTFHFSYIFIPYSESLNRDKLSSDGYVLEYVKK